MTSDTEMSPVGPPDAWVCPNRHVVSSDSAFCGRCGAPRHIAAGPSPGSPRSRRTLIAVACGLVLLLLAGGVAVALTQQGSRSGTETVRGSITIIGGGGYTKYDPCHGISGESLYSTFDYSDIHGGTTVRVLNASGSVIGSGTLSEGKYLTDSGFSASDGCRFAFEVDLDAESTRYQLVVAERPPYDFTELEDLDLSVGPQ